MFAFSATSALAEPTHGDLVPSRRVPPWTTRPWAVEAQVGVANPFGTLALAIDFSPAAWLSLNAGAGLDFDGPQAGIAPRVRFYRFGAEDGSALFVESGVSVGRFCRSNQFQSMTECAPPDDGDYAELVRFAIWANEGLGYELRSTGGFSLRIAAGVDVLLNRGAGDCLALGSPRDACHGAFSGVTPTLNLATGYAF